jgi:hypothetical protein
MKIVYLKWVDSNTLTGWTHIKRDSSELTEIETIGYLLYEDEKEIQIAHSIFSEQEECAGFIAIPAVSILERREIVEVEK